MAAAAAAASGGLLSSMMLPPAAASRPRETPLSLRFHPRERVKSILGDGGERRKDSFMGSGALLLSILKLKIKTP